MDTFWALSIFFGFIVSNKTSYNLGQIPLSTVKLLNQIILPKRREKNVKAIDNIQNNDNVYFNTLSFETFRLNSVHVLPHSQKPAFTPISSKWNPAHISTACMCLYQELLITLIWAQEVLRSRVIDKLTVTYLLKNSLLFTKTVFVGVCQWSLSWINSGPFTPSNPVSLRFILTLTPLTWRMWWDLNNVSRWQMGLDSAFKG